MQPSSNEAFKAVLGTAGLKISLARLKILGALQGECDGLTSSELHERLTSAGEPLHLLCIRQVICRLHAQEILTRNEQGRYLLNERLFPRLRRAQDSPK